MFFFLFIYMSDVMQVIFKILKIFRQSSFKHILTYAKHHYFAYLMKKILIQCCNTWQSLCHGASPHQIKLPQDGKNLTNENPTTSTVFDKLSKCDDKVMCSIFLKQKYINNKLSLEIVRNFVG
jgi:hypothetical protein